MERKILQEFIEIYRSEPSLWKMKSLHYNNKAVKAGAYRRLLAKLRELYPDADLDSVKKKINALRTNFRKEQRKVEASRERAEQTGEPVYVPSLWYYELFSFVAEQDEPDDPPPLDPQDMLRVSLDEDAYYEADEMDDEDRFDDDYQASSPESVKPVENGQPPMPERVAFKRAKRDYWGRPPQQEPLADEYAIFGRYVASRVKQMDRPMQTLAERLISEVLYLGQMGQLSDHFAIRRSDPPAGAT